MIVNDHYTTRGALRASQSKVFSLSKQRLDASNIAAIARIDTQDIAIVDEHGNLDGRAGFERCGFRAALDRLSGEARLGIGNLEFDEHLRLETDELIARIQQRDFVVLLEPL